jgi:hypothetical protein
MVLKIPIELSKFKGNDDKKRGSVAKNRAVLQN